MSTGISGFRPCECCVSVLTHVRWRRGRRWLLQAEAFKQVSVLAGQLVTLHIHALHVWQVRLSQFYLPDLPHVCHRYIPEKKYYGLAAVLYLFAFMAACVCARALSQECSCYHYLRSCLMLMLVIQRRALPELQRCQQLKEKKRKTRDFWRKKYYLKQLQKRCFLACCQAQVPNCALATYGASPLNSYQQQKLVGLHSEIASGYLFKLGKLTLKARLFHESGVFAVWLVQVDGYETWKPCYKTLLCRDILGGFFSSAGCLLTGQTIMGRLEKTE